MTYFCFMNVFYTREIEPPYAFLDAVEARHAVRVLRKRVGDEVYWVDGEGYFYRGRIEAIEKERVRLRMLSREPSLLNPEFKLHLAVAPPKNAARLEWLLEKATEVGVHRITPLLCARSERRRIRPERLQKILISAMKQSGRALLPILDEMQPFGKFLEELSAFPAVGKFVAHCMPDEEKQPLSKCIRDEREICVLIGPEGDFSPEEVQVARTAGFLPVSLSPARLRIETAALTALIIANQILRPG